MYINSKDDALGYWKDQYGLPEHFCSYPQLDDAQEKYDELKRENEKIQFEIKSRDVKMINEFTINRSIELHFLLLAAEDYLDECLEYIALTEKSLESQYEKI